jgi:hypothetical protein
MHLLLDVHQPAGRRITGPVHNEGRRVSLGRPRLFCAGASH